MYSVGAISLYGKCSRKTHKDWIQLLAKCSSNPTIDDSHMKALDIWTGLPCKPPDVAQKPSQSVLGLTANTRDFLIYQGSRMNH